METNREQEIYETVPGDFGKERPPGVTGILRCRNHADFLEACIDSCIDGLDELIAVYHDCTDDTPRILAAKQARYPEKIKVYEYKPYLFPVELDKTLFAFAGKLAAGSVHLLSGYTNYALSKATYRYVVKIDADQVYFPAQWKRLCNAYRSTAGVRINGMEHLAHALYHAYLRYYSCKGRRWFGLLEKTAARFHKFHFSYIEKRVIRDKVPVSLSGINVFRIGNRWTTGLGVAEAPGLFPPFNGVRDHFFFRLSEHTYFEKWTAPSAVPGYRRLIEMMRYPGEILDGGFYWFHLKPAMQAQREQSRKMYARYPGRFVPLDALKKEPYAAFCKRHAPFFAVRFAEPVFSYFFPAIKKTIPWAMLDSLAEQTHFNIPDRTAMRDYYLEFHEELDKRLEAFVSGHEQQDAARTLLGMHNIRIPWVTHLFYQLTHEREHYNRCRLEGMTVDRAMKRVDGFLSLFGDAPAAPAGKTLTGLRQHPWYETLRDYRGQLLVYLFNARQLHYLTPLIKRLDRPVLLVCESELPDNTGLPDHVTALPLEFFNCRAFANPYIEHYFPTLYHYANTFDFLLRILQPAGIICLEGCHTQEQLLAVMAKDNRIPAVCIQQGWPSLMRTGFRRMPFRYFFTWGERFCRLWKKYNPEPEFLPMGYMYPAVCGEAPEKNGVTFFLQSPCFLSDPHYFNDLSDLIGASAARYPGITFMVREHPEYKIGKERIREWEGYPNVVLVSDWELAEVYGRTLIGVSHFSSALMEGVVHGCIPLVYDPTTGSRYYPDVEREKIGKITKTKAEFMHCLNEMLPHNGDDSGKEKRLCLQTIYAQQPDWFAATGNETLERMAGFIHRYLNGKNESKKKSDI